MRILIAAAILIFSMLSCGRHTSDRSLISLFNNNQAAFEEGVQLTKIHPKIISINSRRILDGSQDGVIDLTEHPTYYRKVMVDSEWDAFRSLFRELHLRSGIKVDSANGKIYFAVDSVSVWNGDTEKGIVYSEKPLASLYQHLDGWRVDPLLAYRRIKAHWYLYLAYG